MPLKQIANILKKEDVSVAIEIFERNLVEIEDEITALSTIRSAVKAFIEHLDLGSVTFALPDDEGLLEIVDSLTVSKINFKEERKKEKLNQASEKLYNPGRNQRYWFERKDKNNSKRIARLEANKKRIWWWWLRAPGRVNVKAVYIHGDGNIGIQGNNILKGNISDGRCTGGVRPALWLKL